MFWRDRERETKGQNIGPPCGQVRVLVVGDSVLQLYGGGPGIYFMIVFLILGVGKTSLVNLIIKGSSTTRPSQTIGCTVAVKVKPNCFCYSMVSGSSFWFLGITKCISVQHITYGSAGSSLGGIKGDSEIDYFVELWDVSGHDRYKECRSLFYSQINGVIFVHDLSQRRTKTSLHKWVSEITATGSFSAPLRSGGGLPVPYIVVGNKADVAAKEGTKGSSGNLVDAARQWVEKQGLLHSSEELPLTETFPGTGGLIAAAKEARHDKEAVIKIFCMLIKRRYFSDDLPVANPWSDSLVQRPVQRLDENSSDDDQFYKNACFGGNPYKYNTLPPMPAQGNLTPPPTLYPQQPVSATDSYGFPRSLLIGSPEENSSA